jgi:hypothetical protein
VWSVTVIDLLSALSGRRFTIDTVKTSCRNGSGHQREPHLFYRGAAGPLGGIGDW